MQRTATFPAILGAATDAIKGQSSYLVRRITRQREFLAEAVARRIQVQLEALLTS